MKSIHAFEAVMGAFVLAALTTVAGEPTVADGRIEPPAESTPSKSPALLAEDNLAGVAHVEVHGENPRLIYIPILHDNPEHVHSADGTGGIEQVLVRGQTISEHLFTRYGVRRILLEGLPKTLSDKYNAPEFRGRKLSVGTSPAVVFKVWFDLLNKNEWTLVPAYEQESFGPLTALGVEYTARIYKAMDEARARGWFRTREAFQANQAEFVALMEEACRGYNLKRKAIREADPGLRKEYDITVTRRNKECIDNLLAAGEPGIVMYGGGHVQDLIDQLQARGVSYMIVVPEGIEWPPVKKDDAVILADMLKLGCQLKTCTLGFGDGGSAQITLPID